MTVWDPDALGALPKHHFRPRFSGITKSAPSRSYQQPRVFLSRLAFSGRDRTLMGYQSRVRSLRNGPLFIDLPSDHGFFGTKSLC